MSNIRNWSTSPGSNTSSPPNGAPEGMAPSTVNDIMRQQMADHKTQWLDAEWFDHGDTVSRASASTFKIGSNATDRYLVGRRVKCYDASTYYGTITASSYSAPDTTITVGLDSGSLTASLSSVALAILAPTNKSIPSTLGFKGADVASASTTDLSVTTGDFVDITGTTTITALGTASAGVERTVRFTGALTLTHNGTSLILPGSANISTANGDTAIFRSLGSGNWVCINYSVAAAPATPAPLDAQYVTLATNSTLTSERVLTAGSGVSLTDAGAGSTITAALNISGLTEDTTPDVANDYVPTYDTSAGASKKVKLSNLGGGAFVLISTQTASASATIDFTGLSTSYKAYAIVLNNVVNATATQNLYFRTSTDNGSTFTASAGAYSYANDYASSASGGSPNGSGSATQVQLTRAAQLNSSHLAGIIYLYAPADSGVYTSLTYNLHFQSGSEMYYSSGTGLRVVKEANNAIRFLYASGNITSGTFSLYGLI